MMPLSLPIIGIATFLEHRALAVMRVRHRDGERVGGVLGLRIGLRQQHADHQRICAFSQWPAPTMVFFTRFGAYSATGTPAFAGTSSAMPRAWPSFRVAVASLLTKVASTAASSGRELVDHCGQARRGSSTSRSASEALSLVATEPQATIDQPVAVDLDHAPAGAAEPRIDAEDANRACHHRPR